MMSLIGRFCTTGSPAALPTAAVRLFLLVLSKS
jgi:hypothetical protein